MHKHSGFALYHHFQGTLLFFSSLGIRPVCYPSVFFLSFNHLIIHDYSKNRRTSLSPDSWWRTVLIIHIHRPGLPQACFLICEKLWIQCLATRFVCVCENKTKYSRENLAQCVDKECARNASAVAGWRGVQCRCPVICTHGSPQTPRRPLECSSHFVCDLGDVKCMLLHNVQVWAQSLIYITWWARNCCYEHLYPLCAIFPMRKSRSRN